MAYRIRTIKPEAWQSEQVCRVSRDARYLWVVLITMSDDEGRFRWRPATVLGHGFPEDRDAPERLEEWIGELLDVGLVVLYQHAGSRLGAHPNWHAHQRIDKPKPSTLPAPNTPGAFFLNASGINPALSQDDSQIDPRSIPERSEIDLEPVAPPKQDGSREEGIGGEGKGSDPIAAERAGERDPAGGANGSSSIPAEQLSVADINEWLTNVFALGRERRLGWATSLELESEQRTMVRDLLRATDARISQRVMRDIQRAITQGSIRGKLPDAVNGFINNAEDRAAAATAAGRLPGQPAVDPDMAAAFGSVGR